MARGPIAPIGPTAAENSHRTPPGTTACVRPAGDAEDRDSLLVRAVSDAVRETGAHSGSVFLPSRDGSALMRTASCGAPPSMLGDWRRIPVSSPIPVAVAYRSRRSIHLSGAEETTRRFPQLAVALPYAFGSLSIPVPADGEPLGSMAVVWAAPPGGRALSPARRARLRLIADRLGTALAECRGHGERIDGDAWPEALEVPAPAAPTARIALFDWDLDTGAVTGDDRLCALFGVDPRHFDGTFGSLLAGVGPGELAALRSAVRDTALHGRTVVQPLRVPVPKGAGRTLELWGRVPHDTGGPGPPHLVGAVIDQEGAGRATPVAERLHDGILALDPRGRLTYLNGSLERLLGVRRNDVLGLALWDALPALCDPAYEDRLRAAMVSQQPTSFVACLPPDRWLAFSLHPDPGGVTGRVVPVGQGGDAGSPGATETEGETTEGRGSEAAPAVGAVGRGDGSGDRVGKVDPGAVWQRPAAVRGRRAAPRSGQAGPAGLGRIYHVLQLGSALTEAVTVQQVCEAVAHQLLPAFGGQELALYQVRDGRLRHLSHIGRHERFLAWLDGMSIHAQVPGTRTPVAGTPLFIESRKAATGFGPEVPGDPDESWAYLPLLASGRPVGACVLGFRQAHPFPVEERSALTALGGLIALALERARLYDENFAIARGLQQALLPHRLPSHPRLRAVGRYLPGTQGMDIGGDWYDVIPTGDTIGLVVGDVEGHSVTAAATMGQLRSAVRAFVASGHRPAEVLAAANRVLLDFEGGLLASCCYISLDTAYGRALAVRAGHCPPLLRSPDGSAQVLDVEGGLLLGVDASAQYPATLFDVAPGSVLALYTDGLVEQRGAGIDQGIDQLRSSLAGAAARSLDSLADRLLRHAGRAVNRADDIALLLTEYTAGDPAGPTTGVLAASGRRGCQESQSA